MTDRLTRIRAAMAEAGLDALMVAAPHEENLGGDTRYYVAGFTGSAGVILITPERAIFAADFRYAEQASNECVRRGFEVFRSEGKHTVWLPRLFGEAGLSGKRLGLTTRDMTYAGFLSIQDALAEMAERDRPQVVPAPPIVEALRAQKDGQELAIIQRAIDIADAAFDTLEADLSPELTEVQVAGLFRRNVKFAGADDTSFDTIVAAGPHGAMPHAQPRSEPIGEGRPIVIDMGARYRHYCSDLTRTVVLGKPDTKFAEIYEVVFEAQRAAIQSIEVGMTGAQADAFARDYITARGRGEQFGHGLGHGIGLQVHEAPQVGATAENVLQEGMVFTIEPGIYIPGWGGVRIEDIVILENGKPRVLSHASKTTPQEFEQ
ncbi:MAG: hypothetical protein C0506_01470 [Anaerolinea sp.]|nr:hypothetical protein [Anaerolinea sp.]